MNYSNSSILLQDRKEERKLYAMLNAPMEKYVIEMALAPAMKTVRKIFWILVEKLARSNSELRPTSNQRTLYFLLSTSPELTLGTCGLNHRLSKEKYSKNFRLKCRKQWPGNYPSGISVANSPTWSFASGEWTNKIITIQGVWSDDIARAFQKKLTAVWWPIFVPPISYRSKNRFTVPGKFP